MTYAAHILRGLLPDLRWTRCVIPGHQFRCERGGAVHTCDRCKRSWPSA